MSAPKRTERLASLIRGILADLIRTELRDPRIPPITSITRVEVTADLMLARVYVSVLAPHGKQQLCVQALQGSARYLRWILGRQLNVRRTPTLEFKLDESLQRGFETVQLIDRVMAEHEPAVGDDNDDDTSTSDDSLEPPVDMDPAAPAPRRRDAETSRRTDQP